MLNITDLAPVLQTLFTGRADALARQTGFIRRVRRFTGAQFVQALVQGLLKRPQAPLEDLAEPLGISKQALDQRWTPQAVQFCRMLLLEAVGHALQARPEVFPVLERFGGGVFLDDATQVWLPDNAAVAFAGCGSGIPGLGKARLKILARWELCGGRLGYLSLHPGRCADRTAVATAPDLPSGALYLADLAFLDFERLHKLTQQQVWWVTKLPVQTRLYLPEGADVPLWQQLRAWRKAGRQRLDLPARVGNKSPLPGRLVALACPAAIAQERLRKLEKSARRRGRPVSARQREMCQWTVLFTNVPPAWLTSEQVWLVYRLRWQVELLFKRFKSEGGLGTSPSGKWERVECEWYLKLLGQVVRQWLTLLRGGPLLEVNARQLGRLIVDSVAAVFGALAVRKQLHATLRALQQRVSRLRRRTHRRQRLTMNQLLHHERTAAA